MKNRRVVLHGQTNNIGKFLMSNKQEMAKFFKQWKSRFFIITIELSKTEQTSLPLISYYFKKVVPDMQQGFYNQGHRYTQKKVDEELRKLSPITTKEKYNFDSGKWEQDIRDLRDLDNQELVFFIEHLKEIAAIEFGVYIDDPTTLLNGKTK